MKIYFLASEIVPFSQISFLANFCRTVPIKLQQYDHDIRLTSPKYGYISERKYTLREVIRLREIRSEMRKGNSSPHFIECETYRWKFCLF